MRKILLIVIPLLVAIAVFSAFAVFLNYKSSVGALQVTATPKSYVYVNGKVVGQTPLCKCTAAEMLKTGDYTVKVVPIEGGYEAFEAKVPITQGVLSVVDRSFSKVHSSEGSIITLSPISDKKNAELLILSVPDSVALTVDSTTTGTTPFTVKNLTESDHEVKLSKAGFRDKIVRIHSSLGYRVTVTAFLGILQGNEKPVPLVTTVLSPTASPSATLAPQMVEISQTPTGFLRVRQEASINSAEIAQVSPGETYEYVNEAEGWLQIKLQDGRIGWVTTQYATKITPQSRR